MKKKLYKMKGCSKKRLSKTKKYLNKTCKKYFGGKNNINSNLAYTNNNTSNTTTFQNPYLAYNGTGGGISNAYPSTGPKSSGFNFMNSNSSMKGGNCGCSSTNTFFGGGKTHDKNCKCKLCIKGGWQYSKDGLMMVGGNHRSACKCSKCKMKGGGNLPYPNGLVGLPWKAPINDWPGVNGVDGDRNYLVDNNYNNDISRQMLDIGANRPFLGFKGGSTGIGFTNSIGQDFINLGRQFNYGLGSAYNGLAGYQQPVSPLPWKNQLSNTSK